MRPEPDLRHPDWCDYPDECLAGDPIVASHASTPVRLERKHLGDTTVVAQIWMTADEPLEVATPILALTFDRSDYLPNVVSVEFDGPVAVALLDALMSLRPLLGGAGESSPHAEHLRQAMGWERYPTLTAEQKAAADEANAAAQDEARRFYGAAGSEEAPS